jgi:hypothetical protein
MRPGFGADRGFVPWEAVPRFLRDPTTHLFADELDSIAQPNTPAAPASLPDLLRCGSRPARRTTP